MTLIREREGLEGGAAATQLDRLDPDRVEHTGALDTETTPGPHALRRLQFDTVDAEAATRFFSDVYQPGWRIGGLVGGALVAHRRCDAGSVMLDEVLIEGQASCDIPAGDAVLVIQPRGGSLTLMAGPLPYADAPVLVAHGERCEMRLDRARFDVVSIATDVLLAVGADAHSPLAEPLQFPDWRPRSRAAVLAWHRALDFVSATLRSPDSAQQPLIVSAAARVLGAALFECYPPYRSGAAPSDVFGEREVPDALRDAVAFIHRHAAGDVGINEVAAAVHLTPRAVQYLFRRELDTTPTEYARRVRLHCAHQDLMGGDRSSTSVAAIAQRWGFAHTGRFAVLYRETYGQSPHTTLRR
jgi:AraC-like DNA-binding protein